MTAELNAAINGSRAFAERIRGLRASLPPDELDTAITQALAEECAATLNEWDAQRRAFIAVNPEQAAPIRWSADPWTFGKFTLHLMSTGGGEVGGPPQHPETPLRDGNFRGMYCGVLMFEVHGMEGSTFHAAGSNVHSRPTPQDCANAVAELALAASYLTTGGASVDTVRLAVGALHFRHPSSPITAYVAAPFAGIIQEACPEAAIIETRPVQSGPNSLMALLTLPGAVYLDTSAGRVRCAIKDQSRAHAIEWPSPVWETSPK